MNRLEYFLRLLEKAPDNPMVHYSLAMEYHRAGDCGKALEHARKYLKLQEDEGAVYRIMARCYEEMGEIDKAVEALEKGMQQALKHNHHSLAEEYRRWLEELRGV